MWCPDDSPWVIEVCYDCCSTIKTIRKRSEIRHKWSNYRREYNYRDRYWQFLKQLWFISTPSSHKLLIVPSPSVVVEVGQTEDYATSAHCIDSLNQLIYGGHIPHLSSQLKTWILSTIPFLEFWCLKYRKQSPTPPRVMQNEQ